MGTSDTAIQLFVEICEAALERATPLGVEMTHISVSLDNDLADFTMTQLNREALQELHGAGWLQLQTSMHCAVTPVGKEHYLAMLP